MCTNHQSIILFAVCRQACLAVKLSAMLASEVNFVRLIQPLFCCWAATQ